MTMRTLSAATAAKLDEELLGVGAYSVDQLMELAGLSVSQALFKLHPPASSKSPKTRVLVACGPGNNGGDGLVAARHLHFYGYEPRVYYPKQGKNEFYQRLCTQLRDLDIQFLDADPGAFVKAAAKSESDVIIDAVFGFSFSGQIREPFPRVIEALEKSEVPVLSVDAPSSWNIDTGPVAEGLGSKFMPDALISLTAAKPLVKYYKGKHFIGGRFLSRKMAEKYEIDIPEYHGLDQIVEAPTGSEKL